MSQCRSINSITKRSFGSIEETRNLITGNSGKNKEQINDFTIVHFNMQSVRNKLLLIETELVSRKYDVVCMSEHFLSSTEINCFNLDNYKLASYCVRDKSRGGSLILCQKELFFINREDLT